LFRFLVLVTVFTGIFSVVFVFIGLGFCLIIILVARKQCLVSTSIHWFFVQLVFMCEGDLVKVTDCFILACKTKKKKFYQASLVSPISLVY